MKNLNVEVLKKDEMAQVQGGIWILLAGEWIWYDDSDIDEGEGDLGWD